MIVNLFLTLIFISFGHVSVRSTQTKNHPLKFYNTCALSRLVNSNKLEYFWRSLLRPMLKERVPDTMGNREVQQHIKDVFKGSSIWHVEPDSFTDDTPYGNKRFTNLIVTQKPEKTNKLTLVCHFDSKLFNNFKFVAATDSAVPCAILMDAAVYLDDWLKLGNGDKARDYSLRLLFLDGEEALKEWGPTDSLYGARHLARLWDTQPDTIAPSKTKLQTMAAFILLDLIGEKGMTFQNFFLETTPLFEALQKTESKLHKENLIKTDRKMFSHSQSMYGRHGIQDDHVPFLNLGVPVLHLIASPFPEEWHKVNDNEGNLDWREIDNFIKIFRVFIAQFLHLKVSGSGCKRPG